MRGRTGSVTHLDNDEGKQEPSKSHRAYTEGDTWRLEIEIAASSRPAAEKAGQVRFKLLGGRFLS